MIKSSVTADFFELKPVPERVVGTVTSWFYLTYFSLETEHYSFYVLLPY